MRMQRLVAFCAMLVLALPAAAQTDIREVVSPGGIRAWLVEDHQIPFTALEIRFKGGTSLDPAGKRGAVNLMTATLEEGTGDLDSRGFAAATERLAAQFGFEAGPDMVTVSARMLTETRDAAADLLRRALVEPAFPPEAVERVRGQVLSILKADANDPEAIAGQTFDRLIYGDHPYGSDPDGTEASVRALTREDLLAAKAAAMARDRLYVAAVGDIDAAALGQLLDRMLGALPATGAPMPPPAAPAFAGGTVTVPFAGPQSIVVFGQPGVPVDDPDFFAAYIIDQVLGGQGLGSRLMDEVREKRGLSYGVYSYLVPRDLAQVWMGSFAAANEKVAEAIGLVRAEWRRMAEGGLSEEELAQAKTFLTGSYPLRFDGNATIANILAGMQMDGFPIDYPKTRNARVEAVTMADIRRVAKARLDADALSFVVVGAPEGLK